MYHHWGHPEGEKPEGPLSAHTLEAVLGQMITLRKLALEKVAALEAITTPAEGPGAELTRALATAIAWNDAAEMVSALLRHQRERKL